MHGLMQIIIFELWQVFQGNSKLITGNQLHSTGVKMHLPHYKKLTQTLWEYLILLYPLVMQRRMY